MYVTVEELFQRLSTLTPEERAKPLGIQTEEGYCSVCWLEIETNEEDLTLVVH
jgi:hypothetical protein